MKKILVLLLCVGLIGCASIPKADMSKLHIGMTMEEVKATVGNPLITNSMYVKRQGKTHKTDVKVWEYRNMFQNEGVLLYFYKGELKQIERGYVRGAFWPAPTFEYELK